MFRSAAFGSLFVIVMCVSVDANAQTRAEQKLARKAYDKAIDAYKSGDHKGAIKYLRDAYSHVPDPSFKISIARRFMELGEPESALKELQEIKAKGGAVRRNIKKEIAKVQEALLIPVQIQIVSKPPGAQVRFSDGTTGKTPFSKKLPRGVAKLTLTLEGYVPRALNITIKGTKTIQRNVTLERVSGRLIIDVIGTAEGQKATVSLDGNPVRTNRVVTVPLGKHVIACKTPDGRKKAMVVSVTTNDKMGVRCVLPTLRVPKTQWKTIAGWSSVGTGAAAIITGIAVFISYANDNSTYSEPRYTVTGSSKPLVGGITTGLGAGLVGLGTYWLLSK
jgi:hypothetical protein